MLQFRKGGEPITYMEETWDDRYQCPNAMCMEREVQELVYGLVRALKPGLVVETGAYHGSTSEVIGNALEDNGEGHLFSIEVDERWVKAAKERTAHLPRVTIIHENSFDTAQHWWAPPIDLLIVDGSDERENEFKAFRRFLAPDALVLRHDALRGTPVLLGELEGLDTVILRTPRGISLSQRPVERSSQ